jgi:hypothetical protein
MKATVTLTIIFNEKFTPSPDSWDWQDLLDLRPDESVVVESYEEDE